MPWVVTACSLRYEARDRAMAVGQPTEHVMPVGSTHLEEAERNNIPHQVASIRLIAVDANREQQIVFVAWDGPMLPVADSWMCVFAFPARVKLYTLGCQTPGAT